MSSGTVALRALSGVASFGRQSSLSGSCRALRALHSSTVVSDPGLMGWLSGSKDASQPPPTKAESARKPALSPSPRPTSAVAKSVKPKRHLSRENRSKRFDRLLTFVTVRSGKEPEVNDALQVRATAWHRLLDLAHTGEELERVVDAMSKWRQARRAFKGTFTRWFVGRCSQLSRPDLAVKVFLDAPTYGIYVPDLMTATSILYAYTTRNAPLNLDSLPQLSAFLQVLTVHDVEAPASDLHACSALLAVLADERARTPAGAKAFRSLLPALRALVQADSAKFGRLSGGLGRDNSQLPRALAAVQAEMARLGVRDALWLYDFRAFCSDQDDGRTFKDPRPADVKLSEQERIVPVSVPRRADGLKRAKEQKPESA